MENKEFTKEPGQEGPVVEKDEVIKEKFKTQIREFELCLDAARSVLGAKHVWERILEFDEAVKNKYPEDYINYYALQVLISSGAKGTTSGETKFTEFDFPEKEVENFIDRLEEEAWLKSKNQN